MERPRGVFMTKILILSLIVILFSTRAYFRTLDWRNSNTLFLSALKSAPNDLYKGLRLAILSGICGMDIEEKDKKKCTNYLQEGGVHLNKILMRVDKPAPEIIKYYGLDEHSEKGKAAYVFSFILNEQKQKDPYKVLEPFIKDITDTQIIHHYLTHLIQTNKIDEMEEMCKRAIKIRKSPPALIGLSVVEQRKYKNLLKAEEYLIEAHHMFPYDIVVLQELIRFYTELNNIPGQKYYLKLYSLRIHQDPEKGVVIVGKNAK